MGQHLIRRERLGVPQSARDVFTLLAQSQRIDPALADSLKRMIGFRNIAAHDYQALQLPIMVAIIENHLEECLYYSQTLLLHDAAGGGKSPNSAAARCHPHHETGAALSDIHPAAVSRHSAYAPAASPKINHKRVQAMHPPHGTMQQADMPY